MAETTVFRAKKIITMDPAQPVATHVAVRDGRILAVGTSESVFSWGLARTDNRFADMILLPGFVEGHSHLMAGGIWKYAYVGFHDRIDPAGKLWPALPDIEAVIARLREVEAALPAGEPLVAWGFDPIFLASERLSKVHLDTVSTRRPIVVMHSNFHLLTANSAALALARYDRSSNIPGIPKGADGEPNGELQEMAAMFPVLRRLGIDFRELGRSDFSVRDMGRIATRSGVTTATDLINDLQDDDIGRFLALTGQDDYPLRLICVLNGNAAPAAEVAARARAIAGRSADKLRLGSVKLMTDGSIQGFTGQLRWPGYFRGTPHPLWNLAPEQLDELVATLLAAGVHMHIHANGDLASEVTIQAFAKALAQNWKPEHRSVVQHGQMIDRAQFRRMKALGLCANLFANHLYYFADKHFDTTLGPDRAMRMNDCRAALDEGVPLAIHSDAPVTPLGPLFTAWCAVNRRTMNGRELAPNARLTVHEALRAITLGAAYTLKLDHEIGSIEIGKRADFAVLNEDPTTIGADRLKDVAVWGTVLGGKAFAAA